MLFFVNIWKFQMGKYLHFYSNQWPHTFLSQTYCELEEMPSSDKVFV